MSAVKKLALCSALAALSVLILLLASVVTPVSVALSALAGLIPAVAVIHCGLWWSLGVYAVSGGLGLLLLPSRLPVILYLLFFGLYPVAKSLLERIRQPIVCWIAKAVFALVCAVLIYLLLRTLAIIPPVAAFAWWHLGVAVVLLAAFVFYDFAFSALVSFYQRRIAPNVDNRFVRR